MIKRKNTLLFFLIQIVLLSTLSGLFLSQAQRDQDLQNEIVSDLLITDICLTSEARHTRHPVQADLFSAFQDLPGGLDHFPSSTFLQLPANFLFPEQKEMETP